MTNNGDIINKMMRAGNYHEKEYKVTVDKEITKEFLEKMANGVPILDTVTRPCRIKKIGKYTFQIILTQGLNRQIRRMCEAVGLEVARLKRTYIGPVKLGMLQPGEYRELTPAELSAIRGYMNKAVNRRQNAEGEKAAAERGSRPAKKAPVKPAGKGRTPLGRR